MTFDDLRRQFSDFDETPIAVCGQKEVYVATHPEYGKVAVKRLLRTDARALREAEIAQKYSFDSTPEMYEALAVDEHGQACLVVIEQYIEGMSLDKEIAGGTRFDRDQVTDFLEQALKFVKQISEKNIVHRDIKPGNIIRNGAGRYIFLDFGIARILGEESLTQTGGKGPNTPGYAAPEQFLNKKEDIDTRADLFSVGVVSYELLTGENPFRDKFASEFQVYLNTMTVTPADLVIEGDSQAQLVGLIGSLMSKRILGRPESAEEALKWLARAKSTFDQRG